MKSPGIAVILVALLVTAAGAAEPKVESFVLNDTTYGLQRPVWLYRSAGTTGSVKPPRRLFVFLQKEYIDELAVPVVLEKLVASREIPPTIAVVLDTSTERPADLANRAKFDRSTEAGNEQEFPVPDGSFAWSCQQPYQPRQQRQRWSSRYDDGLFEITQARGSSRRAPARSTRRCSRERE